MHFPELMLVSAIRVFDLTQRVMYKQTCHNAAGKPRAVWAM